MRRAGPPFLDLRSFLSYLEVQGELRRVSVEVDPFLEIAAIARRAVAMDMPAILFEKVRGSRLPVVVNLLASHRRVELALGRDPASLGEMLLDMAQDLLSTSAAALWRHRGSLRRLACMRLRNIAAPLFQPRLGVDLHSLPVLQCWPQDAGPFITLPLVVTKSPTSGTLNVGIYRMQVFDAQTTGMHWQLHKGGGFHYWEAEARQEPLPVAVAIGTDPATLLAAVAPLPEGLSELAVAGLLRGAPTPVWRSPQVGLPIPATAEIVLDGISPPNQRRVEGPFGDHFGHYSTSSPFPVFQVEAMYFRPGAVYLASVVGKPPQEDRYLGEAVQVLFNPLVRLFHPEVRGLWAYYEAGFHNLLVVSVESRYPKEALKTALGLMGFGQLALTKVVVLVDGQVNPRDWPSVLRAIEENFDPALDFHLIAPTSLDTLDFTGPSLHWGSRLVIDATSPPRGLWSVPPPDQEAPSGDTAWLVPFLEEMEEYRIFGRSLLVFKPRGEARPLLQTMVDRAGSSFPRLLVAVSRDVDLHNQVELLWGIFTRFDPARDILAVSHRGSTVTPVLRGPLAIDASWKPGYPAPVEGDPTVEETVSRRWEEYWR